MMQAMSGSKLWVPRVEKVGLAVEESPETSLKSPQPFTSPLAGQANREALPQADSTVVECPEVAQVSKAPVVVEVRFAFHPIQLR
jgi:hypothetical protein